MNGQVDLRLTPLLHPGNDSRAVAVLQDYYAPHQGSSRYTGALFDVFDPSGSRETQANAFTAEDLVAVSFLSVDVPARASIALLDSEREKFAELLRSVGPDRDLVEVDGVDEEHFTAAWNLWRALRALDGVGPTIASKLMARKRPRLIPVFDSVIDAYALGGSGQLWAPLHRALRADEGALFQHLTELHSAADLPREVTALRVFDVLTWMTGRGYAQHHFEEGASTAP